MPYGEYSDYYDLLYLEKDYLAEVGYVKEIFNKFHLDVKSILDIGCGTGKHAKLFSNMGFSVIGVDLSEKMIHVAKKDFSAINPNFQVGDAKEFVLKEPVDAVVSLFSVVGYHTTDDELESFFASANKNLVKGGLLIFDFWYGPAILSNLPVVRVKRVENSLVSLTRLSEPNLLVNADVVDINYTMFVKDKKSQTCKEFSELHKVRYFFLPELKRMLKRAGFKFEFCWEFGKFNDLNKDSWEACIVGVKK